MKKKTCYLESQLTADDNLRIEITGEADFYSASFILKELRRLTLDFQSKRVTLNIAGLSRIDSSAVAALKVLKRELIERGIGLELEGVGEKTAAFLEIMEFYSTPSKPTGASHPHQNFFLVAGEYALEKYRDLSNMVLFIGRLTLSMLGSFRHPLKIRWAEVAYLFQTSGVEALPIIALLSLLIGAVTSFSAAVQLRQFGADIFIANLVGLGMTKELGPLITAIILTGRSGSAFAAEIGTMQISDEIDALTVMKVKPLYYLVMPRIIAVTMVMPFLTLFSIAVGIIGGMLISLLILDLTPIAFISQLQQSVTFLDLFISLLKSLVFGILIAGVGCFRGLETRGGALSVGKSTTSSVVSGIFLVIVADSAFAIVLHFLNIS